MRIVESGQNMIPMASIIHRNELTDERYKMVKSNLNPLKEYVDCGIWIE